MAITLYAEQYIEAYGDFISSSVINKPGNGVYSKQPQRAVASSASKEAEPSSEIGVVDDESLLNLVFLKGEETYKDVQISEILTAEQRAGVIRNGGKYGDFISSSVINKPGNGAYSKQPQRAVASSASKEAEPSSEIGVVDDESLLNLVFLKGEETYKDVQISEILTAEQRAGVIRNGGKTILY